jgi:hypothetical protein
LTVNFSTALSRNKKTIHPASVDTHHKSFKMQGKAWWCVSVIPATWDMDIRGWSFKASQTKQAALAQKNSQAKPEGAAGVESACLARVRPPSSLSSSVKNVF